MKLPLLLPYSPPKKIQCTNNYAPWIDQEFINQSKIKDNLHTKAKLTNSETDWRIFRFQRNHVNNLNKTKKLNYFKHQLNITDKTILTLTRMTMLLTRLCGKILKT